MRFRLKLLTQRKRLSPENVLRWTSHSKTKIIKVDLILISIRPSMNSNSITVTVVNATAYVLPYYLHKVQLHTMVDEAQTRIDRVRSP